MRVYAVMLKMLGQLGSDQKVDCAPEYKIGLKAERVRYVRSGGKWRRTTVAANKAMQMTVGPNRSSYGPLPRSRIACARQ